jgi:hypothetical protein
MDIPGKISLYLAPENLGRSTVVSSVAARVNAVREAIVEGLPLADIIGSETICRAKLIKIDVEGAEWQVLQGIKNLIPELSNETEVLIEVDPVALAENGTAPADLLSLFVNSGFSPFAVANQYGVDFYLRDHSDATLLPIDHIHQEKVDVVFRKV